jgi:hypothetical protein
VVQHGLGGARLVQFVPALLQGVAPDAARKTHASAVGMDHAAIAAGERQERHQVGWQIAMLEVRLEAEQIRRLVRDGRLRRQRAVLPRAVGGDDNGGREIAGVLAGRDGAGVAGFGAGKRDGLGGLPQLRAGAPRRLEQHQIEMLATRARPCLTGPCGGSGIGAAKVTSLANSPTRRTSGPA